MDGMMKHNGVLGLESLVQRFGSWTTFQQYWFTDCFVAHDERKVPYIGDVNHLNPLKYASATDPSTWRNPTSVFAAIEADTTGTLVGIGFVLHGDGTVCIDLDKCVDDDGNITPEAQRILDRFPNTYAEYSLSGRGIHIWLRTSKPLPEDGRRTNGIEIYQNKRYVAITMNILPNRPQDIADYTDELHNLYHELFGNDGNGTPSEPDDETHQLSEAELNSLNITVGSVAHLSDAELIARFLQDGDNATLWNGGQLPHHPSPSEADCSLAYRLLWYTDGDTQRVHRLFQQSQRVLREKIRKRPELVDRAISAAYRYYLQRKQQLQYITQPANTSNTNNWDITQPYPCAESIGTHDYSAKVCAEILGETIVYLPARDEWMVYNYYTGLWENSKAQLYQRVKNVLEKHYYYLAQSKTISDKELERILARIHHGDTVKKVIERMEMMPELHGNPEMFDAKPHLIPLRNGVYDLTIDPDDVSPEGLRRKFRGYRANDYITHTFDANYNPDAPGDYWIQALNEWCWDPEWNIPDQELIEYLWYAIGYTFTGSADAQTMFIIYGPGGNGKSTLVSTIARIMGNYATMMHQNLFVVDKNTSTDPARQLEPLCNKRMVMHPELPSDSKLDTAKLKRIVSNEPVLARRLYHEARLVYPTWTIWCTANDIPEITDQAAWRRIKIIPFRKVFVPNIKTLLPVGQLDPELPHKLWEQRDYLATQGCHYAALWWKNKKLPTSTTVEQATADVHRVSDPFEDWFQRCVEIDPSGVVPNDEAYKHYKQYVESLEQSPLTMKKWAQRMAQKRVPVVRKRQDGKLIRCRTGIKLIQPDN
jgi:P4 family phage/plasmid primase-like protien